jgi:hypothetical protein
MASKDNRKTPVFDWETGEFALDLQGRVKTETGAPAVEQIILKAQQTIRGLFLIYAADPEVPESQGHTYGSDARRILASALDEDVKLAELERAVREALIYDPWIKDVYDITLTRQGQNDEEVIITATVDHIFGTTVVEGVTV